MRKVISIIICFLLLIFSFQTAFALDSIPTNLPSASPSESASASPSESASASPTESASASPSPSESASATSSESPSASPSPVTSPSPSGADWKADTQKYLDSLTPEQKQQLLDQHQVGSILKTPALPNANNPSLSLALSQAQNYPSAYDLRQTNKVTSVKDQSTSGACWTFAATASLESCLMPGENRDFSENNLKNNSGFDVDPNKGGNNVMATAYYARWSGPVNETDDPYDPNSTSSTSAGPVQKHVQNVIWLDPRQSAIDNNEIKNAIMTYGAVQVSMYMSEGNDQLAINHGNTKTYYTSVANQMNHDVTIVGWDDTYAASNFCDFENGNAQPAGNGAFIVKNSWGSSWGENGYFYVSYYDVNFSMKNENRPAVFYGSESPNNYAEIYQYDPLGFTASLSHGYYMANVFTAASSNSLSAVSFYTLQDSMAYNVYVVSNYTGTSDLANKRVLAASGTISYAGYYTVNLNSRVSLTAGNKFAVIIDFPNSASLPVEKVSSGYSSQATASAGQSYYAESTGTNWNDLTLLDSTANFCIKAFTTDTQPPTVTSITPSNGSTMESPTFTISANGVTDMSGVKSVYFKVRSLVDDPENSIIYNATQKGSDWNATFNLADFSNKYGTYIIEVYGTDILDDTGLMGSVTDTVAQDINPPTATDFLLQAYNGASYSICAHITDPSGVKNVLFEVFNQTDGIDSAIDYTSTQNGDAYTAIFNQTDFGLKNGKYVFNIYATDNKGNFGLINTQTKDIETVAVTSISPDNGPMWGGIPITVKGVGLANVKKVMFGDNIAPASFTVNNDNSITVIAPAWAGSLTNPVSIHFDGDLGTLSTGGPFKYNSPASNNELKGITFGNNLFVAGGDNGTIMTSPDGINWAQRNSGLSTGYYLGGIAYGNGKYICIWNYTNDTSKNVISTSTNGVDWEVLSNNSFTGEIVEKIVFGNNTFAVCSDLLNHENCVTTSSDGINWIERNVSSSAAFDIEFVNNQFMMFGDFLNTDGQKIWTSTNGANWSSYTVNVPRSSGSTGIYDVRYGNGLYVALGGEGCIYKSTDGINWVKQQIANSNCSLRSLAFGDNMFVASYYDGDISTSTDGNNWDKKEISFKYLSVAYGNHMFVAAGDGIVVPIKNGSPLSPPVINSITPSKAIDNGETTVTINGVDFTDATAVNFGSSPAVSYTVNSDTAITATAPSGTGTIDVTVTGPGGTSAVCVNDKFTYYQMYHVNIGTLSNGSITTDKTSAAPGDKINLTITPDIATQLQKGSLKYNDGSDHTLLGTSFIMPSSDVTITAAFEAKNMSIKFDSQGGSSVPEMKILYNSLVTSPVNPVKKGYKFAGWYKDSGYSNAWNFDTDAVTNNITLYAKWITSYTVTFITGRASTSSFSISADSGSEISAPTQPSKSGYTFAGWYKDSTYSTAWNFSTDTVNGDVTLYAKWCSTLGPVGDFVTRFYNLCLSRDADPSGLNSWVNALKAGQLSGADTAKGFILSDEFKNKNLSNSDYVTIMYDAFFGRSPDQSGLSAWTDILDQGFSRYYVMAGFVNSDEFKAICSSYGISVGNLQMTDPADKYPNITSFVARFYKLCLGRGADPTGLNGWVNALQTGQGTGAQVAYGFVFSNEFTGRNVSNSDYVTIMYKAFFNRDPDSAGYNAWLGYLNSGTSRQHVLAGFVGSQEFLSLCNSYGIKPGNLNF